MTPNHPHSQIGETMSPLFITDHLDTWTSAIKAKSTAGRGSGKKEEFYGIKKLRELILELAVRGFLVPQDPEDEPASELLKKIRAEEARMVKDGKIKKRKALPKIKDSEKPFVLPGSWSWIRLAEAGHDWGQNTPDSDFTYIDVGSINKEKGLVSDPSVLSAGEAPSRARKIVKKGTVIYSTVRPYLLNIAVVGESFDPEPIASTAFAIIHPFQGIEASFIYRYLRSPTFIIYVESCQTGIAYPAINDKQFFSGVLPIPPLAEEHRIVAKVDELMALCDQLEQRQEDNVRTHATLVETLLGALTTASERGAFAEAWQRIAAHFDTLFTTESSIDQLKQTILQLAVMGKIVEQDPEDESVEKQLAQSDDRRRVVAQDDRRATKDKQTLLSADLIWNVPDCWVWRGLADIVLFVDYRGKTPTKISSGVRLLTAKNVRSGMINLEPEEFISEEEYVRWMTRGFPKNGDILFTTEAPMGNAAVIELTEHFALAQRVICFQNYGAVDPNFLVLQLLSTQFQRILDENGTGMTAKGIKATKLKRLPVAIPPLAEQHRIVAKVDELMALCDRLKARLQSAQTTQLHLADSLVETAIH